MENNFFSRYADLCRRQGKSPNAVARELGIPSGSVTSWKQGSVPRNATLSRLADHFGTTVDYLIGKSEASAPVTDDDIKFALFGGDCEITDAMYQEVRQFAQFVKQRHNPKKE